MLRDDWSNTDAEGEPDSDAIAAAGPPVDLGKGKGKGKEKEKVLVLEEVAEAAEMGDGRLSTSSLPSSGDRVALEIVTENSEQEDEDVPIQAVGDISVPIKQEVPSDLGDDGKHASLSSYRRLYPEGYGQLHLARVRLRRRLRWMLTKKVSIFILHRRP